MNRARTRSPRVRPARRVFLHPRRRRGRERRAITNCGRIIVGMWVEKLGNFSSCLETQNAEVLFAGVRPGMGGEAVVRAITADDSNPSRKEGRIVRNCDWRYFFVDNAHPFTCKIKYLNVCIFEEFCFTGSAPFSEKYIKNRFSLGVDTIFIYACTCVRRKCLMFSR